MKATVAQALATTHAQRIANYTGNSTVADYSPDANGRVAISLRGDYTVDELKAKLADLEMMQAIVDDLRGTTTARWSDVMDFARDTQIKIRLATLTSTYAQILEYTADATAEEFELPDEQRRAVIAQLESDANGVLEY